MLGAPVESLAILAGALAVDLVFGEPPGRWHPVVWMGGVARWALQRFSPRDGAAVQLAFGALLAVGLPVAFGAGAWLLVRVCSGVPGLSFVAAVMLLKSSFAVRALREAAFVVRDAVAAGDLTAARAGLRSLCSRDASALGEAELVGATVESVAENASDSIVAPILFYLAFGVPGAIAYRAVNTLDAMIGYRGENEYLGKAAARLDDLLNVVPARLTALLLLAGGALVGEDVRAGFRILWRDATTTESPNAGYPMAAMAGLLGVVLEKRGHYRLGGASRGIASGDMERAWRVVVAAVAVGLGVCIAVAAMWIALDPLR